MEKLKKNFKKIVEELGYYLYDVIYEKKGNDYVLEVLIENDTFIDIDDCVKVSKVLSEELDITDPFNEAYNLEVSSSGAERELRNSEEILRAVGKNVMVQTLEQKFEGKLKSYEDGFLEILQKNKRTTKVNYIDVSYVRLAIIF
jgi:ribosome maturation factor RimP